jgi:XTP/dITP diphosphohydrolase
MKTILASRNKGKLREFAKLLQGTGLDLSPLSDWPAIGELKEEEETFVGNARSKAWEVVEQTGLPALADDSGLAVDYLDGRPGVFSARYGGPGATVEEKNQKLLAELQGVPEEDRGAAFVCVLVLAFPGGREVLAEGRCQGLIAPGPKGENGFGYDPIFFVPGYGRTMAQLGPEIKNRISHRAKAASELNKTLAGMELE